jgi:hypothetical protein
MIRLLGLALLMSSITSCSLFQNTADGNHKAVCKQLKREIIFNAATGNNTEATQQRGELNRLNKSYNTQGC